MNPRAVLVSMNRRLGGFPYKTAFFAVSTVSRFAGMFIPKTRFKRYCPCCETKLWVWGTANFKKHPDRCDVRRYEGMPQDVVCPVCGSIPRHRIIVWHLGQRPELVLGKRVLHFAPERGVAGWFARHGVDSTSADLFAKADLKLDLMDIDLPDASYDVVMCNHVLEHVADWRVALSELHRVLRPGGLLICSFPVDPSYPTVYEDASVTDARGRIEHFGQYDHLRVFGRDSEQLLVEAGFRVEVVWGADCPDVIRPVRGPADYDSPDVFLCWKD